MTRDLHEDAVRAFHQTYRDAYPTGGDEQDHDEAVREAVAAVVALVTADLTNGGAGCQPDAAQTGA